MPQGSPFFVLISLVPSGKNLPDDFNVVIEIPMHGEPVKYEVDKESGAIFVDRFMNTAMHDPCNYGYIPNRQTYQKIVTVCLGRQAVVRSDIIDRLILADFCPF